VPEHRRAEAEAEAFDAVRSGVLATRKDPGALAGFDEHVMLEIMALLVKRGTEKKMLKPRAIECLKLLCAPGSPWLRAALGSPAVSDSLREFFSDSPDALELLEAPLLSEADTDVDGDSGAIGMPYDDEEVSAVNRLLLQGCEVMRQFNW
ncbi:unnamed protein product, partial [Polarella glacialis]